jgi:hypothetical protein
VGSACHLLRRRERRCAALVVLLGREAGRLALGRSKEEKGGREQQAAGGERKGWAKPKSGREREMSFSNFPIYVLLKYFEKKNKTNLKRKTSHTKIHAAA